ncbi:MAG: SRPBCC domain-containing protein, partial [Ktedonobacterales bacterium]
MITRVFDAPREMVWNAWTDAGQIVKWWGPHGFTLTIDEMDVRPGGVWKSTMRGPDGTEYLNDCVFTEVVRPRLIAYQLIAGGRRDGGMQEPMEATWIFEAQGDKTKITLRML